MKKRAVIVSLLVLALIIITGGVSMSLWNRNKEVPIPSESGKLVVNNGAPITENVVIHFIQYGDYADLPFTEVMKGLDMSVVWVASDTAEITHNDKKYILGLSEVTFVESGKSKNLIIIPPGTKATIRAIDRELILDSTTMQSVLYGIGVKVDIDIDVERHIVYVNFKTD